MRKNTYQVKKKLGVKSIDRFKNTRQAYKQLKVVNTNIRRKTHIRCKNTRKGKKTLDRRKKTRQALKHQIGVKSHIWYKYKYQV